MDFGSKNFISDTGFLRIFSDFLIMALEVLEKKVLKNHNVLKFDFKNLKKILTAILSRKNHIKNREPNPRGRGSDPGRVGMECPI